MSEFDSGKSEPRADALAGEVRRLREALAAAETARDLAVAKAADWEQLFEALPDLVAVIDAAHRIVRLNRRMADRLNVRAEDAVGRPCYELVHGSGAPPAFCPHAVAVEDGQPHSAEIYEPSLDAFFLVSVSPLRDAAGRVTATVHVISELRGRRAVA